MDPGTALSIAQLVYETTRDLYEYYRAWKHCDRDVEELRVQLLWLHDAFRVVRHLLEKPGLSQDATSLVYSALEDCDGAASELSELLEKVKKSGPAKTLVEKLKVQGRKACYPFRKRTIAETSEVVDTCRHALNLAVDLLHLDLSNQMERKLQLIDEKLTGGFDTIDDALQFLPDIQHDIDVTKHVVLGFREQVEIAKQQRHLQDVLQWLRPHVYGQQLAEVLSKHKAGTDRWFLDSAEFQAWLNGTCTTLFCPGHPGTGKTVLAAAVIDYLMRSVHCVSNPVIYLFCDYKRQSEQTGEYILSSLIRQVVHITGKLPTALDELYDHHDSVNTRPTLGELELTFRSIVRNLESVYIVLDALDECENKVRTMTLRFLKGMQEDSKLLLLATSRFIPDVRGEMQAAVQVEIQATDEDVKAYVTNRLVELARCVTRDVDLQQLVVKSICAAVQGMFLLARLHVDSLRSKRTIKAVKVALQHLPQGSDAYNDTYEDAMTRIYAQPDDDRTLALEAIAWVAFARRPLRDCELEEALAIEPNSSAVDPDAVPAMHEILNLCAGLLTRDEQSGIVRLVHYTAHEYIMRTARRWLQETEVKVASKCLTYISFPEFTEHSHIKSEIERRLAEKPFYAYSANHWGDHLCHCEMASMDLSSHALLDSAVEFLNNRDLVLSAIQAMPQAFASLGDGHSDFPITAQLVARFGSVQLMQRLSDAGVSMDMEDSYGRTPLWWAVCRQHELLTRFLLDSAGVDATPADAFGHPPIFHAAGLGNAAIVKMFLGRTSIDINRRYRQGRTVLAHSAIEGKASVVELLLGADGIAPNIADDFGNTPLLLAAKAGHEAVVERLLTWRNLNSSANNRDESKDLRLAAHRWQQSVMDPLMKREDSVSGTIVDWEGTALALAVSNKHAAVAQTLLRASEHSLQSYDDYGRTPTMWALASGHDETIETILRAKISQEKCEPKEARQAELTRRDVLGCSFLHLSARDDSTAGVLFALANGIDINHVDYGGWTPLHWSVYFRRHSVARLLLRHGASVSAQDLEGRTCHTIATLTGNELFSEDVVEYDRAVERGATGKDYYPVGAYCNACGHYCVGTDYHCTQCPVPPGYDLCFRCIRHADVLHAEHAFETTFRYMEHPDYKSYVDDFHESFV